MMILLRASRGTICGSGRARAIAGVFVLAGTTALACSTDESNEPSTTDLTDDETEVTEGSDVEGDDDGGTVLPTGPTECVSDEGDRPDFLSQIGCARDFTALAAEAVDTSLPGAVATKFIIDRVDEGAIYFQSSEKYPLHYDFASTHLSAVGDLPVITNQTSFNDNYFSEQRRFYLGTLIHYEGPDEWVFELAPYDTASAEMIAEVYEILRGSTYFGTALKYHPSGTAAEDAVDELPEEVAVITTDALFAGIDYQPLTIGKSCGRLVFRTAAQLETEFVSFQDIVVLDSVPNDISVAQGIITAQFQTPLSHVNVLSQNRGTPNMGLRNAFDDEELRALEGEWVTFEVGPHAFTIEASDPEAAEECLITPAPIDISPMNLEVTDLTDIETIYDPESDVPLKEQISVAIPAFGGKASHYSALAYIEEAKAPKAFAIPVFYYDQFMSENGFDVRVDELLADPDFAADPATRDAMLELLRDDMEQAPINEDFMAALLEKLEAEYPGIRMRFRSSTNAEDLGDFTGAGLYTSKSGDPNDPAYPVEDAIRKVWASIWFFRAFEERAYRGIDHKKVGMALLVHRSFPDESANGVAVTANPFDATQVEPGFYVNAQLGDNSVVQPDPGVTTDQFIYYFDLQGQPVVFLDHSNLVPEGQTVLSSSQIHELGVGLKAVHQFFYPAYGKDNPSGWYAMDVEFKFDAEEAGEVPRLYIKQARPYPGR